MDFNVNVSNSGGISIIVDTPDGEVLSLEEAKAASVALQLAVQRAEKIAQALDVVPF